jgi:SOS response regulatory protein OraA/RecX
MKLLRVLFLVTASLIATRSGRGQDTFLLGSSTSHEGGKTVVRHSNGFNSFNVEMRGRIEVTEDDRDIKSMSPDGYLEITKTVFGSKRTLVISPQGSGLKREYYEGRTSIPYEPEGRKWLGEIMPELIRSTLIGAESRVARFYRQGGVGRVLTEISEIESDYVRYHYADFLLKVPGVTAKDYPVIINQLADLMDSDHYLTELLQNNLDKFLATKESANAVFNATKEMESDHYKTQVIKEALRQQQASPEGIKSILAASSQIDSDHYKTEVLTSLLRQPNLADATVAEMIVATNNIDSDHYRTIILNKALDYKGLSSASYQKVLESVRNIDSDHYKTEVLKNLLENKLPTEQVFTLVDLSSSIDSDHYLTIVFTEALEHQDLSDDAFKRLIDRAAEVDSDHYASTILRAALELPNLNDAKVISIISAAAHIESDHYITEVLTASASRVRGGSPAVRDAYRTTAKRISSETYYGRAMRAID